MKNPPFTWQTSEVVTETTAVNDIAEFLYPDEYSNFGYDRKKAKARVRETIKRYRKKEVLAKPVSPDPKRLEVRDFLSFACNHWPKLQTVITSFDSVISPKTPKQMGGEIGQVQSNIEILPSTYKDLLPAYRSMRETLTNERERRRAAETKLKTFEDALEKRRRDGGTRPD